MTIVTTVARRVRRAQGAGRVTNLVPVPMTSRRGQLALAVASPTGDMAQQMRAMSQVGVLFAIVDKLATGCAGAISSSR